MLIEVKIKLATNVWQLKEVGDFEVQTFF